jgi:hypothetical protein
VYTNVAANGKHTDTEIQQTQRYMSSRRDLSRNGQAVATFYSNSCSQDCTSRTRTVDGTDAAALRVAPLAAVGRPGAAASAATGTHHGSSDHPTGPPCSIAGTSGHHAALGAGCTNSPIGNAGPLACPDARHQPTRWLLHCRQDPRPPPPWSRPPILHPLNSR